MTTNPGDTLVALAGRDALAELDAEMVAYEAKLTDSTRELVTLCAAWEPPLPVVDADSMPCPYDDAWTAWVARQDPEMREVLADPFNTGSPRTRTELRGELAALTFEGSFTYRLGALLIAHLEAGDRVALTKGAKSRRLEVDVFAGVSGTLAPAWLAVDERGILDANDVARKVFRGWSLAVIL